MKDKHDMSSLVSSILGSSSKKEEKEEREEEDKSSSPRQAIAQDLIDALRSGDADAVVEALEAFSSSSESTVAVIDTDSDCGCK